MGENGLGAVPGVAGVPVSGGSESSSNLRFAATMVGLVAVGVACLFAFVVGVVRLWRGFPWWTVALWFGMGLLAGGAYGSFVVWHRIQAERDREHGLRREQVLLEMRRVWAREKESGLDENGDDIIGRPAMYRGVDGGTFVEPEPSVSEKATFAEFLEVVCGGGVSDRRSWGRRGMPEPVWERFRARLVRSGIAHPRGDQPNGGLEVLRSLDDARAVFREFV